MLQRDVEVLLDGVDEPGHSCFAVGEVEGGVDLPHPTRSCDPNFEVARDRQERGRPFCRTETQDHDGVCEVIGTLFLAAGQDHIALCDTLCIVRADDEVVLLDLGSRNHVLGRRCRLAGNSDNSFRPVGHLQRVGGDDLRFWRFRQCGSDGNDLDVCELLSEVTNSERTSSEGDDEEDVDAEDHTLTRCPCPSQPLSGHWGEGTSDVTRRDLGPHHVLVSSGANW